MMDAGSRETVASPNRGGACGTFVTLSRVFRHTLARVPGTGHGRRGHGGRGVRRSVRAATGSLGGHLPEAAAELFPRLRDALDVELDAPELELPVVVPQGVRGANVAIERHADAPGIDQRRSVRSRPPELQMAVAEDD